MSNKPRDEGPPFGAVYFGSIVTVAGAAATFATYLGGPAILVSGVVTVCTGLILRALYWLR